MSSAAAKAHRITSLTADDLDTIQTKSKRQDQALLSDISSRLVRVRESEREREGGREGERERERGGGRETLSRRRARGRTRHCSATSPADWYVSERGREGQGEREREREKAPQRDKQTIRQIVSEGGRCLGERLSFLNAKGEENMSKMGFKVMTCMMPKNLSRLAIYGLTEMANNFVSDRLTTKVF